MYARYIPPSKGPNAPGAVRAPAAAPAAPTPANVPSADGFSYARYVPGSKPAKEPKEAATIQYFNDEPSPPKPKRKRETADDTHEPRQPGSKKSKKGEEPNGVKEVAGQQDAGAKKKKNRRKRKQRTRADSDDSDSSEDELPDPEPDSAEPEPSDTTMEVEQDRKPDKKKCKEKSKHREPDAEAAERIPEAEDKDVSMVDANETAEDAEVAPVPEPGGIKEKKRKKEKKKKRTEEDEAAENGLVLEQEDLRHKAILERKTKSLKLAGEAAQDNQAESDEEPTELHGLEPLPQPAVVAEDESKPTYDTLPPWLANPIRVSQDTRASFKDLGIPPKPARILKQRGFAEAFAVQTAAIPLLLPTSKSRPGDVLISAATGSGKTLAYALPIVRDISQGVVTRLRALVVLPPRELVKQAQEVFEVCARAYDGEDRKKVRIGTAIGSQSIKSEHETLMESESRYDPEAYKEIQEQKRQQRAQNGTSADVDDIFDFDAEERDPRLGAWEGQVVDFSSRVDVLICTPGRLVEHMDQTPGFSLDYVRWLVVDEADKILAQSFQGWLDLVLEKLQVNKFSARDFSDMEYSGVRKVVLSATLTRDLSLLGQLALRRPQLVVLENDGAVQIAEHTLPASLKEFAIRVHEANLKPLYLLDLLRGQHMSAGAVNGDGGRVSKQDDGSDSDSSSDSSDTSSASDASPPKAQLPHTLIFTKSNESALRLSRLLALLDGSLVTHISTLTSTTATHMRGKTLRAFTTPSSPVRLIIASDLVARGIDIPKLGHVINYDLPASVAGYVHRVGRTARAGRCGCAWTLVGDDESGWFWGRIAKGRGVRRAQKVERIRIEEMDEERVKAYEGALATLGKEALEMRRR
ncbi:ATP-dependent RNA helicase dbp6 [Tolypocladium ophioglossoides CBS 100239]|uniref:ATP-dependent RNA helicase n=1 Tax=Tolypocladium ophioglossoides (strain CBS 100239) TaxID=1163406 RepID=A0A0L0NK50_TOLOC|nr:ATP-dependent RNA helicase dbp6 [Tolypocladium ophioglossoides CBS 100239]